MNDFKDMTNVELMNYVIGMVEGEIEVYNKSITDSDNHRSYGQGAIDALKTVMIRFELLKDKITPEETKYNYRGAVKHLESLTKLLENSVFSDNDIMYVKENDCHYIWKDGKWSVNQYLNELAARNRK